MLQTEQAFTLNNMKHTHIKYFQNRPKLRTYCTFKDASQFHITLTKSLKPMVKTYKVVAISLSFQSSTLLFINLSNSLVIVLRLMLPLCGMLFQMRFVPLHPWPPSESSLKPTCTPKHTHLSLDHPLVFSVVL